MSKVRKKMVYEKPKLVDLGDVFVKGQVQPQGMCIGGGSLTFAVCTPTGNTPAGGSCAPTGVSPEYGYCDSGNVAVEGCISGTQHF